jgi:hypothetical protein
MYRPRTVAALCVLLLIGTSCGPLRTRSAVPKDQLSKVSLDGYNDARYWGDEPNENLYQTFIESWQEERAANGLTEDARELPDAHHLVISGGGQNGAFGAGVLCGWSASGKRPVFNIVTGISTGALIAPFAFLGSDYDSNLRDVYTSVDQKDIAVFQGFIALLRGDAAYNTAPLSKLAEKYYTGEMLDRIAAEHRKGRRLFIGTTNLDAGRPVVWDMGRIARSNRPDRVKLFHQVLLASAAIPAAFPPMYLKVPGADGKKYDEMHVDGGVTREMFLLPSELRLYELRDKHGVQRHANLYIIRNSRYGPEYEAVHPQVGSIAARSIDTLIKAQAGSELWALYFEAKENKMSFAVTSIPDDIVDDSRSMFDRKFMTRLFDAGYELGRNGTAWRAKPSYEKTPATQSSR